MNNFPLPMTDPDSGTFDVNDLSGMVKKISTGATRAFGNISMSGPTIDSSNLRSDIKTETTNSLANISIDGYDPPQYPFITNCINTRSSAGLQNSKPMVLSTYQVYNQSSVPVSIDNMSVTFPWRWTPPPSPPTLITLLHRIDAGFIRQLQQLCVNEFLTNTTPLQ